MSGKHISNVKVVFKWNWISQRILVRRGLFSVIRLVQLSFNDYEYCLNSLSPKRVDIKGMGSDLHSVFTYSTEKMGLWICDDGISTYAFGHWKTEL